MDSSHLELLERGGDHSKGGRVVDRHDSREPRLYPFRTETFEADGERICAGSHQFARNLLRSQSSSRSGSRSGSLSGESSNGDFHDSSPGGIEDVQCPKPLCSSSPLSMSRNSISFDRSVRDPSGFEGEGGNLSVIDPVMLQTEIQELRFQVTKYQNDISELRIQLSQGEDAQQALQGLNEQLENKLSICKSRCEKLQAVIRELEEVKTMNSAYDDQFKVQKKRIERLEKDYAALVEQKGELTYEFTSLRSQLEQERAKGRSLEADIGHCKVEYAEKVQELLTVRAELEGACKLLQTEVSQSKEIIEELRLENKELEGRLSVATVKTSDSMKQSLMNTSVCTIEDSICENGDSTFGESLHAEITASVVGNTSVTSTPQFRHDSLISFDGSGYSRPWYLDSIVDHPTRCRLNEILELVLLLRSEYSCNRKHGKPDSDDQKGDGKSEFNGDLCKEEPEEIKQEVVCEAAQEKVEPEESHDSEIVRRIQDELAELRLQLKKSQELFTASNQSFSVTKSCPLLSDDTTGSTITLKPGLQTCSTQTEESVLANLSHQEPSYKHGINGGTGFYPHDRTSGFEGLSLDEIELDRLSDDEDSVQLSLGLPTVDEESEQETDASTTDNGSRGMSSGRSSKRKLRRMPNMIDDSARSENGTLSPDQDFHSAMEGSASYNSLGRPLQISASANGHCDGFDAASMTSENDTTFGSPITSPSSPSYYFTPSQGSSSQETLSNPDGDRTPVNEYLSADDAFATSPAPSSLNSTSPLRRRTTPVALTAEQASQDASTFKGVVSESDKSVMTRYAYDAIRRITDDKAKVLPRSDWRNLRKDLTDQEMAQYNKHFAQEEGSEDTRDGTPGKSRGIFDLDDEAEIYALESGYPNLAEQLFKCLDSYFKGAQGDSKFKLTAMDVEKINKRFTELSTTFKTEHSTLDQREKRSKSELEFAEARVKSNIDLIQNYNEAQDVNDVIKAAEELQQYTPKLVKKAKEIGRIDLEKRIFKMIEVMTMYVHILRNFEVPDTMPSQGLISVMNGKDHKDGSTAGSKGPGSVSVKDSRKNMSDGQWMRELSWPWSWEQSVRGVQRCFTIILILAGLVMVVQSVFPSATAEICPSPTSPLLAVLEKYSNLEHNSRPLV